MLIQKIKEEFDDKLVEQHYPTAARLSLNYSDPYEITVVIWNNVISESINNFFRFDAKPRVRKFMIETLISDEYESYEQLLKSRR
ncbi:MAG TPA: hypothetical protein V6C58_16580 [Allocoleopsis sp.]